MGRLSLSQKLLITMLLLQAQAIAGEPLHPAIKEASKKFLDLFRGESVPVPDISKLEQTHTQWEGKDRDGFNTLDLTTTMGREIFGEGLGFGMNGFTSENNAHRCANWHVTGTCWFLSIHWAGIVPVPTPSFSLQVSHYNPEAVISVYNDFEKSPWQEARHLNIQPNNWAFKASKSIGQSLGVLGDDGGAAFYGGRDNKIMNQSRLTNKQADAIGFPDLLHKTVQATDEQLRNLGLPQWISDIGGIFTGLQCPQQNSPFTPHYLSGMDFLLWQTGYTDLINPASYVPYLPASATFIDKDTLKKIHRDIRTYSKNPVEEEMWGNVFPRTGWVVNDNDYKASATIAQRVASIITQNNQPHVYIPIGFSSKSLLNQPQRPSERAFDSLKAFNERGLTANNGALNSAQFLNSTSLDSVGKVIGNAHNQKGLTEGLKSFQGFSFHNSDQLKEGAPSGWAEYKPPQNEALEGDFRTHKMQLIHPVWENQCHTFPYTNNKTEDVLNEFGDKISTDGSYAWVLWRPYSCCKKTGTWHLGTWGF